MCVSMGPCHVYVCTCICVCILVVTAKSTDPGHLVYTRHQLYNIHNFSKAD